MDITFTITTCKRYNLFKSTMDSFLSNCLDHHKIKNWICIDDNSSDSDINLMKSNFPFFTYICKSPDQKGHAKSMNILLETVTSEFILHFEDDWICQEKFSIEPYIIHMNNNLITHLVLKPIAWGNNLIAHEKLKIHNYIYNPKNEYKPKLNKLYDIYNPVTVQIHIDPTNSWWWPGFTLNPSIINLNTLKKKVGIFNEFIPHELFEYDYALRCYDHNIIVQYADLNIQHSGHTSSYKLNDTKRYYD